MRLIILSFLITILLSCNQEKPLNGSQILSNSIKVHDPSDAWGEATLNLYIQEPRISNPHRYSIVKLDNSNNTFELTRNRGKHISRHIIDSLGNSFVILDEKMEIDTGLVKKYRLSASRNADYKKFYQTMYGLPMSLSNSTEKIINTTTGIFAQEECYKIQLKLKEKIISRYWHIFISTSDMKILGIEITFPDDPSKGERLFFDKIIEVNGMKIPRIRHWHNLEDNEYSGSDIILKESKE